MKTGKPTFSMLGIAQWLPFRPLPKEKNAIFLFVATHQAVSIDSGRPVAIDVGSRITGWSSVEQVRAKGATDNVGVSKVDAALCAIVDW